MAGHESSRQHRRGTCSCSRLGALEVSQLQRALTITRQVRARKLLADRRDPGQPVRGA